MLIVDFLVKYWQYISIAVLVVLDIVTMIIKKRPKKFDEINQLITEAIAKIPGFVIQAEETGKDIDGADKKQLVLGWCFTFIENVLKRDLTGSEELYCYKALSYFIESVLTAPTKKGGLGREEA